jgi:EAL domain-containing protein (putative c-di-GMP-specific phosphodiesterase class I)/ActR/RegA family two-component response regulator
MNAEPAGSDTKACVLVVDDDDSVRTAVRRILNSAEFNVTTAANAREALEILDTRRFDAIVTDIMMPEMDGLELLRRIRHRDREMPVIILTGHPTLESAVLAVNEGSFRYMMKPFAPDELCTTVREAAALYRLTVLKRRALEEYTSGAWQTGEHKKLSIQFDIGLRELWIAFQPIIDWPDKRLYGYEALVRSSAPNMGNPGLLFDAAERLGRVHELGRKIRSLVADAIHEAPPDAVIFVNLHSADLNDAELFSDDSPLSLIARRVVLEVTERASLERVKDVQGGMSKLRGLGFRIAVDDLGAGYAGLSSFSQLEPDIVKLDMSLIRDINVSNRKSSIVRSMIAVCARDLGTLVVCEGVETEAERDALDSLGATLHQGYLFGRPEKGFRAPVLNSPSVADLVIGIK